MSERKTYERALGPYKHGNRWQVILIAADGRRELAKESDDGPSSFESFESAKAFLDAFSAVAETRTVGDAVTAYLEETKGSKVTSNTTTRYRLLGILRLPDEDRILRSLTTAVARQLYVSRVDEVAVATHQSELGYASRFCVWCVDKGWLKEDPFAEIKPFGEPNRGKPKLRVNTSRQFVEHVEREDSVEATAVLTAFMLGIRASAIVNRLVEDLDDDGHLLWVRDDKTKAGDREIEVPERLRVRLLKLARGKGPTERLFGEMTRHGLHYHTVRLCKEAGVPRVTPHGLRGTLATNRVRLGDSVEDVARALGQDPKGKGAVLRRHYLGAGAEESARARQMDEMLGSNSGAVRTVNEEPFANEEMEGWN